MARRIRLDLAYDGAPFAGFARQPDQVTVQGRLEEALSTVADQQVVTTCAGRTDRGVHALAQVVHADLDETVEQAAAALADLDGLARRLDHLVGGAIAVRRVREVPEEFDARFSAVRRRYRYRVVDQPRPDPRLRHVAWLVDEPLDTAAMRTALAQVRGEHDFSSFCRRPGPGATLERRLEVATVARVGSGEVRLRFAAPAFCHQQIRSVVGCLAHVGWGRRPARWLGEVLAAGDRQAAGAALAPPHGLTLTAVDYGPDWPPAPVR